MSATVFTIVISIVAFIGGILAFSEEIAKSNRKLRFINKLWVRIFTLFLIGVITILSTIWRDKTADKEEETKFNVRDAINRAHIDSITFAFTKELEESKNNTIAMLGRYGYKIDSANNQIIKAIDSSTKKEIPLIEICKGQIKRLRKTRDSLFFNVAICNKKSDVAAYNIRVRLKFIVQSNGNYITSEGTFPLIPTLAPMEAKEGPFGFGMKGIPDAFGNLQFDTVFIAVNGTYENYNNTLKPNPVLNEFDMLIVRNNYWGEYDYTRDAALYDFLKLYRIRN